MRRPALALARASLIVGAAALAGGCHRGAAHCAPGIKSTVELRDGAGGLELALKGHDLCDGNLHRVGTIDVNKDEVVFSDPSGRTRLDLKPDGAQTASDHTPGGQGLRLFRGRGQLRVLHADGVPYGSVTPQAIGSLIFDPANAPIAKVERRDPDAVVTDLGGTALHFVVPARDPAAAGVFAIPKLDPAEAFAVYLFWSR